MSTKRNQESLLKVSSSNLTVRTQPFIYEVRDCDGNLFRHCGQKRDADYHVMNNPGFTWCLVPLSPPPKIVDVQSTTLESDLQLPESQLEPLNLEL